jgi:hypothetical protein
MILVLNLNLHVGGRKMARYQRLVDQSSWLRCQLAVFALAMLGVLLLELASSQPAAADWLAKFRTPTAKLATLDAAAARLRTFAASSKGPVLAATVSQEGHWTFVNQRGEKFTAASPDELKRVVSTLAPENRAADTGAPATGAPAKPPAATGTPEPAGRLTLLLTEDVVFDNRVWLKDLPKGTDLRVVVDDDVLRLHVRGDLSRGPATPATSSTSNAPAIYAEIRPHLLISATSRAQFDEAVWQLHRPLKTANIRVLSLEPGGPPTLTSAPKLDPATRRPLIDRIDPLRAADGLKVLRGQTALMVGRVDGKLLFVRGSSGPEQSVILADLVQAAEAADVNLILLQSASARQPGARNWLWQKAEVAGLDDALARAQLSDLLAVLGTGERPLAISPASLSAGAGQAGTELPVVGRVTLSAIPDVPPGMLDSVLPMGRATEVLGGAFDDVMSGLTGKVTITQARLYLQSRQRASELQGRLVPSVPTGWIEAYLGALMLGVFGWRWTSAWWQRLWPREARSDYAGVLGFRAAQAARALLMAFLFLPLAGVLALPAVLWSWFNPANPDKSVPTNVRADAPRHPAPPGVSR